MFIKFLTAVCAMIAPFGSWESPITSDLIVQETIGFYEMKTDGSDVYWSELHPKEKGRYALVKYAPGIGEIPLLAEQSVRTRVHEYGGGAFFTHAGNVYFSNDEDRQLYCQDTSGQIMKLTDAPDCRFADGTTDGKALYFVMENHTKNTKGDDYSLVENSLVRIENGKIETIASGHDFYACPRVSPDGKKIAYFTWDFPNMPWDGTTLWLAEIGADGKLHQTKAIAGGPDESICQIAWSPKGELHFVSDRTGFWNIYKLQDQNIECLVEMEAEFGNPHWVFGYPTYTFLSDGRIVTLYTVLGVDDIGIIDPKTKSLESFDLPYTKVQNLVTCQDKVYFFGGQPTKPTAIVCLDPESGKVEHLKQSFKLTIPENLISKPEMIEYPTAGGQTGYGFYYPPTNPNFEAPEGEKPPLVVKIHGGPTARSYVSLSLDVQYWTSRGFAFLDVNYGGSTGYGREYFKRLERNWGVVDVEDTISAAKSLVKKGLADEKRLLIRGGSAGGYTTLAALAFHDLFAAGTSYYGVSDVVLLYEDTHKFEAQYSDLLVGVYPDEMELIRERSPINHIEKFTAPVLLLQGKEDKIVLPNQTLMIYDHLKKKGTPVGMRIFEGEGHGFRMSENIKASLDSELYFYSKILGIELAEPFDEPPVEIENL